MKTIVTWQLPIKTANEANSTEHWTVKWKRHKLQKRLIKIAFLKERPQISIPCLIVLTRIASNELDRHDNLPMSFKWIFDAICDNILPGLKPGMADSNPNIKAEYRQEKGKLNENSIKVEIYSL